MATQSIFREASLDRLSTPERLDAGLAVVGAAGWALVWGLALLILGGLIWACLVIVPVTVKGEGILLAPGGVLEMTSGSQGRVRKFVAQIGDEVHEGQIVAEIDQPQLRQELEGAEGELQDALDMRARTANFQGRRESARSVSTAERRRALEDAIKALTEDNALIAERLDIQQALSSKGMATREKYLEIKLQLGRQREELARNQVNLTQLNDEEVRARTDDEKELLQLEQKVASSRRRAAELAARLQGESTVKSPYSGRIAELKVNVGEIVERGTSLFTVLPLGDALPAVAATSRNDFGTLVAVVYVPPSFGKQVKAGDTVQVAVSTARREEFGFVVGRVRLVAGIPSTAEGMQRVLKNRQLVTTLSNNAAPFEVLIDLYADKATLSGYRWSSSRGPAITLNGGTPVSADIEVRSVPILALAVPQVRELLESILSPKEAHPDRAR